MRVATEVAEIRERDQEMQQVQQLGRGHTQQGGDRTLLSKCSEWLPGIKSFTGLSYDL